ncbi:hypothetical protein SAMN05414137_1671, partial [Streptacidiphilus jiangxiensis]
GAPVPVIGGLLPQTSIPQGARFDGLCLYR